MKRFLFVKKTHLKAPSLVYKETMIPCNFDLGEKSAHTYSKKVVEDNQSIIVLA